MGYEYQQDLTYEYVFMHLEDRTETRVKVNGSRVEIQREKYVGSVHVPTGVFESATLSSESAQGIVALFDEDIQTVEDFFPELREFYSGIGRDCPFSYHREPNTGDKYSVVDFSGSRQDDGLFSKVVMFEDTPEVALKDEYKPLVELARHIGREEGAGGVNYYIEADTLREATEMMMQIYRMKEYLDLIE